MLPRAEDVTDGPYELRLLKAPALSGLGLGLFAWLIESRLGSLIYPIIAKQSGVTQVSIQIVRLGTMFRTVLMLNAMLHIIGSA